jgi:hypothetical protein
MIDVGFLFLYFLSGYPAMQANFTSQQLTANGLGLFSSY